MNIQKRTLEQTKLFTLVMNSITAPRAEEGVLMQHVSYSREALEKFIEGEMAEGYWEDEVDGKSYNKRFKKGSPFEMYNHPVELRSDENTFEHGIRWEWIVDNELESLIQGKRIILV